MFYLTTHFIYGYMVKGHRDCERENLLPPLQEGIFSMYHPTDTRAHSTAFVTPVLDGTSNSFMGPSRSMCVCVCVGGGGGGGWSKM